MSDINCTKLCRHWGRSQEECISDTDGVCKGRDGKEFRDYCDTRFPCIYPDKCTVADTGHGPEISCSKCFENACQCTVHQDVGNARGAHAARAPTPPIAPAQWSTTPPREPGIWFWRFVGDVAVHVAEIEGDDCEGYPFEYEGHPREWWPIQILEPPR